MTKFAMYMYQYIYIYIYTHTRTYKHTAHNVYMYTTYVGR